MVKLIFLVQQKKHYHFLDVILNHMYVQGLMQNIQVVVLVFVLHMAAMVKHIFMEVVNACPKTEL